LIVVLVLGATGCGGGSSPTTPPVTPPPSSGIQFTADGTPGTNTIYMTGGDGEPLQLEVRTNSVTGLYGVSFELRFPSNLLQFSGVTEGSFLGQGGVSTSLQVTESPAGTLIVGISRLGEVAGVDGSGLLATFEFTISGSGSGTLLFAANQAFDATGAAQGGVTWLGGSVQVTQ